MGKNRISGFVIAVVIGALALAPHAAGGNAAQSCPQSSRSGCEPVGARPSEPPSRS